MQATILDLRRRMPEVLRALERQEEVTILYRGKKRAVLVPAEATTDTRDKNRVITDHPAFGMWATHDELVDVAAHVRTLRRGRVHAL